MQDILKQEYSITNTFDEKMAFEALSAQLSSLIFKELINNEKSALKITFTISVSDGVSPTINPPQGGERTI